MRFPRRPLLLLAVALTACAMPAAAAEEGGEEPPPEVPAEAEVETQTYDGGGTTTTHKPYTTTTTEHVTTTTRAPTTTAAPTTTVPTTNTLGVTTTTGAPTTTAAQTTTTAGATTTTTAGTTTTLPSHKVFVCKYVGTPGVDERLQTGDNPISVDFHSLIGGFVGIGVFFQDAQGRSVVIAFDTGQPEPNVSECPNPNPTTTTTTSSPTSTSTSTTTTGPTTTGPTTTAGSTTTSTGPTTTAGSTTTTGPVVTPFAIEVEPTCPDGTLATIEITFGNRPDLNAQVGTLTFSTGGSIPLTFIANTTVEVPYPTSAAGGPVTMTYTLGAESVTRSTTFPEACALPTTTTVPTTNTFVTPTTTTLPGVTTTTLPGATTTTLPAGQPFSFGAATTVCVREVPTIRITFVTPAQFPSLVGQTGTLTMADVNGNVVSTQPLVYTPGATVDLLYPGTRVNADGTIADVPGWNLNSAGFWVRDPSDAFLREGINLTYVLNPTATAFVTYPPESANCANPDGPFPPGVTPPPPGTRPPTPGQPPSQPGLPATGNSNADLMAALAFLSLGLGSLLLAGVRRR
jgi:hypothetical protein